MVNLGNALLVPVYSSNYSSVYSFYRQRKYVLIIRPTCYEVPSPILAIGGIERKRLPVKVSIMNKRTAKLESPGNNG